jgi:Na+-driven multidrug efflux pump
MSLVGSISMGIAVKVMSGFGDLYIATYGVLFRLITFGFMPIIGISTGALPIIGYNFGAKKYLRVRQTVLRAVLVSTAITLGAAVIIMLFPRPIASVFNRNTEFLDLAEHAFRFALIGFAFVGSQVIFSSFFQGIGKGVPAGIIGISRQLLFLIPALLLLANLAEPRWVWLALPIADVGSFILSIIWTTVVACRIGIGIWGECRTPREVTE